MNGWEKINWLDYKDYKSFYHNAYGLIEGIQIINLDLVNQENKIIGNVYVESNRDSNYVTRIKSDIPLTLDNLFNQKYYVLKNQNSGYYYGYNSRIEKENVELLKDFRYSLTFRFDYKTKDNYASSADMKFIVSSKKEFSKKEIFANKKAPINYQRPTMAELKKGQNYFYLGKGECEIVEVFDYPNDVNKMCKIKYKIGDEVDILLGDENLVYIPMNVPESPLKQFNYSINELMLQPMVFLDNNKNIMVIMWQSIEGAARYNVKVYQYQNKERNMKNLYFLKNYEVEREVHVLSLDKYLVNDSIIIVVSAEDREGNILAQSRGINTRSIRSFPRWFNEYNL